MCSGLRARGAELPGNEAARPQGAGNKTTQLIYPVYSPLRNLIPRTQGQGTSHQAKVITSVSGALPGQLGTPGNRFSIPELPAGGGIAGSNWPNQLPASGTQASVNVNIP